MFRNFFFGLELPLYFSPEDGGMGSVSDLDTLQEDAEPEPEPEVEEESTEEVPDEETPEEELDENVDNKDKEDKEQTDEEKEEEAHLTATYTDIKTKYPKIFKEFPELRAAIFRDQRMSEIFGSPDDAEAAASKAGTLDNIEDDIINKGNVINLLNLVEKNNKASYEKIVTSILPHIQSTSKDLYLEIAAVPIKQLLRSAWATGKGKDTDLGRAAAYIHNFFFGNTDIDSKVKFESVIAGSAEKTPEQKAFEERLAKLDEKEYTDFKGGVDNSYITKMSSEIRSGLDKDARLTEYAKNKLVEDILIDIKDQLVADTRYQTSMQSLWLQAKKSGFTSDFKSRITNAALARAKALIPTSRQKKVAEATKTVKVKDDKVIKPEQFNQRRESKQVDRAKPQTNQSKKPMSDIDILRSR